MERLHSQTGVIVTERSDSISERNTTDLLYYGMAEFPKYWLKYEHYQYQHKVVKDILPSRFLHCNYKQSMRCNTVGS